MINIYKTKVDLTEDFENMVVCLRKEELRPLGEYADLKKKYGNYEIVYTGPDDFYPYGAIVYIGGSRNISYRIGVEHIANFDSSNLKREHFKFRYVISDKPKMFCKSFEDWIVENEKPVWNELVGFGNGPTMGRFYTKTYHTEFDFFHPRNQLKDKPAPFSLTMLGKKLEAIKENYFNTQGILVNWEVSDMIDRAHRSPKGYYDGQYGYVRPY